VIFQLVQIGCVAFLKYRAHLDAVLTLALEALTGRMIRDILAAYAQPADPSE